VYSQQAGILELQYQSVLSTQKEQKLYYLKLLTKIYTPGDGE